MFFDPATRELLRTRPNPLTPAQVARLRGARPAGPPPRPAVRAGPGAAPRLDHRRDHGVPGRRSPSAAPTPARPSPCTVSDTTLAIELDDGETRVVRRTTTQPVRNIKADRPWTVPSVS